MKENMGRFFRNEAGATAIFFALAIIPVVISIGLAFDLSRMRSAKSTAASALDAAALATARTLFQDASENINAASAETIANGLFVPNTGSLASDVMCEPVNAAVQTQASSVEITTRCTLPTTFSALVGVENFTFSSSATATVSRRFLDLSLMLDTSGSMQGERIEALREAAQEAVETLITDFSDNRARIAIAPYNNSVNIGDFFTESTGVALVPQGGNAGQTGANGLPLVRADNLFSPESNAESVAEGFEAVTCATEREGVFAKTNVSPDSVANVGAESNRCPHLSIVPLTSDRDLLSIAISDLEATPGGLTAGHLGIEWAWYLISDAWSDVWPAQSDPLNPNEVNVVKATVLMTDGRFNHEFDANQGDSAQQALDVCDAMKVEGVIVFAVAFQAPTDGEDTLRDCASSLSQFYSVDTADELVDVYTEIATQLSDFRLAD